MAMRGFTGFPSRPRKFARSESSAVVPRDSFQRLNNRAATISKPREPRSTNPARTRARFNIDAMVCSAAFWISITKRDALEFESGEEFNAARVLLISLTVRCALSRT